MYPKTVYELLPFLYLGAGWISLRALSWPFAFVPASAFFVAALLVWVQRWYYRRQVNQDDDGG